MIRDKDVPGTGVATLDLSVVAPAHNERENISPLLEEIRAALDPTPIDYEIIVVDDASTDDTLDVLRCIASDDDRLRILALSRPAGGGGNGQSAAFRAGIAAASGRLIATLDADLQNDPVDIPRLCEILDATNVDMAHGDRSHARCDNVTRRVTSLVGRAARRVLLADTIRDTGCSMRVMRRELAQQLPLEFRGMHRFIPVTARQLGFEVVEVEVNHRPRMEGKTNYGIWNRALPGLIDCLAVRWMRSRRRVVAVGELDRETRRSQRDVEAKPYSTFVDSRRPVAVEETS